MNFGASNGKRSRQPGRTALIQIPVWFTPGVAEALVEVAAKRQTTSSIVIGDAIASLVEQIRLDPADDGTAAQRIARRRPPQLGNQDVGAALNDCTRRVRVYIPRPLADDLDYLCVLTALNRAQAVRLAVGIALDT